MSKTLFISFAMLGLVLLWQQCADVTLEPTPRLITSSHSGNPFMAPPPSDYQIHRRLVILLDMSNSMISGPCPQDVNGDMLFRENPPYEIYDPNKGVGDPYDHRASGIDCRVNPQLEIHRNAIRVGHPDLLATPPVLFETPRGLDYEGDRLKAVSTWINQALTQLSPLVQENTSVLIYPITGGISQTRLLEQVEKIAPIGFYPLQDDRLLQTLDALKRIQSEDQALAESYDILRSHNTRMGTTSPGEQLPLIFQLINEDMKQQQHRGFLPETEYDLVYFSDGLLGPISADFNRVMNVFGRCRVCQQQPRSCPDICVKLLQRMERAWGRPESNTSEKIEFQLQMIQGLSDYFGAGQVRIHLVQIRPDRLQDLFPGESSFIRGLSETNRSRFRRMNFWTLNGPEVPFDLIGVETGVRRYRITNVFVFNANARLTELGELVADSDGDGVPDFLEVQMGTDPLNPRTNGVCLDSIYLHPAYRSQCEMSPSDLGCDPLLDSDGDGLNECEEKILGTNPYDFDTDGDGAPDLLEWLYGYNPLLSDRDIDSRGDGYMNIQKFALGVGPMVDMTKIDPENLVDFSLDFIGHEQYLDPQLGDVSVDLYHLLLNHIPTVLTQVVPPENTPRTFQTRIRYGDDGPRVLIPPEKLVLGMTQQYRTNQLLIFFRLQAVGNPDRAYWRLKKIDIPVGGGFSGPVNLSGSIQLRTIDYN